MRIILLGDINSIHLQKWAIALAKNDCTIGIFSFNKSDYDWCSNYESIEILHQNNYKNTGSTKWDKLKYFKHVNSLKFQIKTFNPNIVHAHYATSYGLIGALSGFENLVISAWGTDVMKFPEQNYFNKAVLKYALSKAKIICATSKTIETYIHKIVNRKVEIIPFGVDTAVFKRKTVNRLFDENTKVIGCVKGLEKIYNIDVVIQAFAKLIVKHPNRVKLVIVGTGTQEAHLKNLVKDLNIIDEVRFTGRIKNEEVSNYLNAMDIFVNVSEYESFGVSVIESMACMIPVVVTNVGGLSEIVSNDSLGQKVEVRNINETLMAMERYLLDEKYVNQVVVNGRKLIEEDFDWKKNVIKMKAVYNTIIK